MSIDYRSNSSIAKSYEEEHEYHPNDGSSYFPLIFPDMYKRACKEAPYSTRGRIVLPWYRNKYQNKTEVVNCTAVTEQEINHAIFDLADATEYWSPRCCCLKVLFWLILIIGIVAIVLVLVLLTISILLRILIAVVILVVMLVILACLCCSYKSYLMSREYAFKLRANKSNQRIFAPLETEMRVGTFGGWLEVIYDPDQNQINARDFEIRDRTIHGDPSVQGIGSPDEEQMPILV